MRLTQISSTTEDFIDLTRVMTRPRPGFKFLFPGLGIDQTFMKWLVLGLFICYALHDWLQEAVFHAHGFEFGYFMTCCEACDVNAEFLYMHSSHVVFWGVSTYFSSS